MASNSVKSSIARVSGIEYSLIEELKHVRIPEEEQRAAREALEQFEQEKQQSPSFSKSPSPVPLPQDIESLLEIFNNAAPLKCVRMPKREQRVAEMYIDDHPGEAETVFNK